MPRVFIIAPTGGKIVFSIALGFNPRQLKKDLEGWREHGLNKCPSDLLLKSSKKDKTLWFIDFASKNRIFAAWKQTDRKK